MRPESLSRRLAESLILADSPSGDSARLGQPWALKPVGGIGSGVTAVLVRVGGCGAGQGTGTGNGRPVTGSKAAMASSQLLRLSSGSQMSPAASKPVQRTSMYGRP